MLNKGYHSVEKYGIIKKRIREDVETVKNYRKEGFFSQACTFSISIWYIELLGFSTILRPYYYYY